MNTSATSSSSCQQQEQAQASQQEQQALLICPNCGSKEIEHHDASGASICTDCGVVVEENAIVSSVEFVEGAGGSSNMVGQFVSASSNKAFTGGGRRYGFSRDSRETTLANGRRRIQDVAARLRLGSHYVDAAHRLFTIAVEKNFVQGRRTTHVVAACLYIACRQEKSQHMLIDFSDALQVNVYTLGTCFLKFRRLLGLKLEIIDPALYVYRFAAHLDLADKANAVALTALRLVGRMKRDWIVAGRRPAGICAAALLIAARAHGFGRHHSDVTRILRVCGLTVTQRVKEFEATPSAQLTLQQFGTVELETEVDPPVFTRNRFREAKARAIQEGNPVLLEALQSSSPTPVGKRVSKNGRQEPKLRQGHNVLYQELEHLLQVSEKDGGEGGDLELPGIDDSAAAEEPSTEDGGDLSSKQIVPRPADYTQDPNYPTYRGRKVILPNQASAEELQESTQPHQDVLDLTVWKQEMPQDHVDDIESIFRTDEEVAQKEAIFNSLNKEYLVQQERKESERVRDEQALKEKEQDVLAQAEGHARYMSKSNKRKKRQNKDAAAAAPTTEEALYAAVSSRKISRKINYDAMSALFSEGGGFSTEGMEEDHEHDPLFAMV